MALNNADFQNDATLNRNIHKLAMDAKKKQDGNTPATAINVDPQGRMTDEVRLDLRKRIAQYLEINNDLVKHLSARPLAQRIASEVERFKHESQKTMEVWRML